MNIYNEGRLANKLEELSLGYTQQFVDELEKIARNLVTDSPLDEKTEKTKKDSLNEAKNFNKEEQLRIQKEKRKALLEKKRLTEKEMELLKDEKKIKVLLGEVKKVSGHVVDEKLLRALNNVQRKLDDVAQSLKSIE